MKQLFLVCIMLHGETCLLVYVFTSVCVYGCDLRLGKLCSAECVYVCVNHRNLMNCLFRGVTLSGLIVNEPSVQSVTF